MNIDQLPAGRELDALIAEKAMGLRPCVYHQCGSFSAWATMWKCECGKSSECFPSNKEAIEHEHSMLPKYSTDIAAAWTVVEKLRDQFIEICQTGADSMGKWTKWQCEFDAVDGEAVADTISLAICRAALKAVKP